MSEGFLFKRWQFDVDAGRLTLHYHDSQYGSFEETFEFPSFDSAVYEQRKTAIDAAFDCLFWMAGVSYYKTQLAETIAFEGKIPDEAEAAWLQETWQSGLAELAYQNQLPWLDRIQFPCHAGTKKTAQSLNLRPRSMVALGGGKDSLVSAQYLIDQGEDIALFMVGNSEFIQSVAGHFSCPLIQVKRQVDGGLKMANETGAYNGHVPITAINACVGVVTALLLDYDAVVFSNERSANVGNVSMDDDKVANHQYSKSLAFEQSFQQLIKQHIGADLHCFSLLRPFSELDIVRRFTAMPQHHTYFSSCNRNFHLSGSQNQNGHWCRRCPKCAFVFLTMAMFLDKKQVIEIFGGNLLADVSLKNLFAELLGVSGIKPFECVGEIAESRMAFEAIAEKSEWQEDVLVQQFQHAWPAMAQAEKQLIMTATDEHMIPDLRTFRGILNDATD